MMAGGIFIGKCSKASITKVPTFCLKNSTKEYYYCTVKYIGHAIKSDRGSSGSGMKHAAPVILAFWSE